jgi:hypothetical protein
MPADILIMPIYGRHFEPGRLQFITTSKKFSEVQAFTFAICTLPFDFFSRLGRAALPASQVRNIRTIRPPPCIFSCR